MADPSKITDLFSNMAGKTQTNASGLMVSYPIALVRSVDVSGDHPVLNVRIKGHRDDTQVHLTRMSKDRVGVKPGDIASIDSLYYDNKAGQTQARWVNKAGVFARPEPGKEPPVGATRVELSVARVARYDFRQKDGAGAFLRDARAEAANADGKPVYITKARTQVEVLGPTQLIRSPKDLDKALESAYAELPKIVPSAHPASSALLLSVGTTDGQVKVSRGLRPSSAQGDNPWTDFNSQIEGFRTSEAYKTVATALQSEDAQQAIAAGQLRITVTPRTSIGLGRKGEETELARQDGSKAGVSAMSFYQEGRSEDSARPGYSDYRPSSIALTQERGYVRAGAIRPLTGNAPFMRQDEIALCAQELAQEKFFTTNPEQMPSLTTRPLPSAAGPEQSSASEAPQAPQAQAPQAQAPQAQAPQAQAPVAEGGFADNDFGAEDFGGDDFSDQAPAVQVPAAPPIGAIDDFDDFATDGVDMLEERLTGKRPSTPAPGPR